jgi:hypothetical protein
MILIQTLNLKLLLRKDTKELASEDKEAKDLIKEAQKAVYRLCIKQGHL